MGLISEDIKSRMRECVEWNGQKPDYLPVTEYEVEMVDKHWIGITRARAADNSMDVYNLWDTPLLIVEERVIKNLFDE